ncbi:uncharacterized protein BDZ99DRAFT_43808 [Mytilinidion resinicola]|uniref:NAD(P)-binding protein n=1 Tax=Mytilinidion resinicola TaxID=574789 RepID=A0A6A6YKE5_9PEZI|nr:uncharacterized protein BDZ99DRAFT_43808 [Mytilinidion resinicola]KAF2809019.1 hypothetical protein BDZ99DRAFT_43808 [Mytilinidion resinicola]
MTHTLAMEWAPHHMRVNSVSPGLVNTAMNLLGAAAAAGVGAAAGVLRGYAAAGGGGGARGCVCVFAE